MGLRDELAVPAEAIDSQVAGFKAAVRQEVVTAHLAELGLNRDARLDTSNPVEAYWHHFGQAGADPTNASSFAA